MRPSTCRRVSTLMTVLLRHLPQRLGRVAKYVATAVISASSSPLAMRCMTVLGRVSARNACKAVVMSADEGGQRRGMAPWLRPSGP